MAFTIVGKAVVSWSLTLWKGMKNGLHYAPPRHGAFGPGAGERIRFDTLRQAQGPVWILNVFVVATLRLSAALYPTANGPIEIG